MRLNKAAGFRNKCNTFLWGLQITMSNVALLVKIEKSHFQEEGLHHNCPKAVEGG
jgi:hypothetical protein